MASVWCAEDTVLGRQVAIKVLGRALRARPAVGAAVQARGAGGGPALRPPARGDDLRRGGVDRPRRRRRPFIVMEYLAGRHGRGRASASARSRAPRRCGGCARRPRHSTTPTARGSCTATSSRPTCCSTAAGVLHVGRLRDRPHLSEDTITATGQLFGTAAYLAPEQALGRSATAASDRYALAVAALRAARRASARSPPSTSPPRRASTSRPTRRGPAERQPDAAARRSTRSSAGHGQGPEQRSPARQAFAPPRRPRSSATPAAGATQRRCSPSAERPGRAHPRGPAAAAPAAVPSQLQRRPRPRGGGPAARLVALGALAAAAFAAGIAAAGISRRVRPQSRPDHAPRCIRARPRPRTRPPPAPGPSTTPPSPPPTPDPRPPSATPAAATARRRRRADRSRPAATS